jgi:hypothetical protein
MQSVWVKWNISSLEYWELTINDVLGELSEALGTYSCEARDEEHGAKMYVARTNKGPYVLCRRCCKKLGLPLPC